MIRTIRRQSRFDVLAFRPLAIAWTPPTIPEWIAPLDCVLGSLQFSADSSTVGYVASRVPYEDARVVVGDEEQEVFDEVKNLALGPRGKRVIYQARKGESEFAVVDDPKTRRVHMDIYGELSPEYDEFGLLDSAMARSRGKSDVVIRARRGDTDFVLQMGF